MYENGKAELQEYAQNQPTYQFGSWNTSGGEYVLSFYKGKLNYHLKERGDQIVGIVRSKFVTKTPWTSLEESWLVVGSNNILNINLGNTIANVPHQVIVPGIPYPKEAYLNDENGSIDISFDLEITQSNRNIVLYKPMRISVINTSMKRQAVNSIIERFKKYRYSMPPEFENKARYTDKIILTITDQMPRIQFEKGLSQLFETIE
ncbi:hypothetical protein [Aliiglaciecola sp. LCG003]|uniref:hypothetical protein n=1 Tax=Aliiglaciecola sp. LCG003 TaxID=3053655 RepID=UPI00257372E4|nr:hypothetical protein [Aliiglaciecola sp. LCG003]WJG07840.1 hypothetical protein QR722_10725 [Aliiglaciecola sp. LCG003]